MKNIIHIKANTVKMIRSGFLVVLLALLNLYCFSEVTPVMKTMPAGSFIINMGVVPQTVANGLKPYGLIYTLIMEQAVPIHWIINPDKLKDGIDFSYNGYDFKGGPFILEAQYRIPEVDSILTAWEAMGVVGVTTTSEIYVPVFRTITISSAPRWTLDFQNGALALPFFVNAGIPLSAYGGSSKSGWKTPAELGMCDDIFVMPHADPTWATHKNLIDWNDTWKGAIWLGCHAGSALNDMFNPAIPAQQANFLAEKDPVASGAGPYYQNALVLWGNHSNGTPPYTYENGGDPVMQFMGPIDAATLNGSEQIYIPTSAGWRTTTKVGGYDPDNTETYSSDPKNRAVVIAYGPGMGDPANGMVMLEAGHSLAKASAPDNIAAQRAFFNFSFFAAKTTAPDPGFVVNVGELKSGSSKQIFFTVSLPRKIKDFNIAWSSSCGGTFVPSDSASVSFTAPQVSGPTNCTISIRLTEKSICQRAYKYSTSVSIICGMEVATTIAPACFGLTNGSISMAITGGEAPYIWSWTRSGVGSGSGTGTLISGLAPDTYTVTVTSSNNLVLGAGCSKTFTVTVLENPVITATATPTSALCIGSSTGSIGLSFSGPTPGYTYLWADGPTTQNRSSLAAGNYSVVITDAIGCTQTASAIVGQPDAIVITPTVTHAACIGTSTGAISLAVSGGTSAYTYLWNNGSTAQNRTGLNAGTYSVTVTDVNSCTQTLSGISVTEPTAISASAAAGTISCYEGITTLTVTASGGTGTLQYSLNSGAYQPGNTFTVTASGSAYNVTVKDANNCTTTTNNVLVSQPTVLTLSTTHTNEYCPGTGDGTINLTPAGGTPPYAFLWSNSATTEDISSLTAGTYSVTVTDAKGCTAGTTVIITTTNPNPVKPITIGP